MRSIKAQELKELLNRREVALLLDVREPWEYELCHIVDSILIPLAELPRAIETLNRNSTIVVICHHGVRSFNAAGYLEQQGFSDVINLEGGVDAWAQEVDPEMSRY